MESWVRDLFSTAEMARSGEARARLTGGLGIRSLRVGNTNEHHWLKKQFTGPAGGRPNPRPPPAKSNVNRSAPQPYGGSPATSSSREPHPEWSPIRFQIQGLFFRPTRRRPSGQQERKVANPAEETRRLISGRKPDRNGRTAVQGAFRTRALALHRT
jgi:hypothetical protein